MRCAEYGGGWGCSNRHFPTSPPPRHPPPPAPRRCATTGPHAQAACSTSMISPFSSCSSSARAQTRKLTSTTRGTSGRARMWEFSSAATSVASSRRYARACTSRSTTRRQRAAPSPLLSLSTTTLHALLAPGVSLIRRRSRLVFSNPLPPSSPLLPPPALSARALSLTPPPPCPCPNSYTCTAPPRREYASIHQGALVREAHLPAAHHGWPPHDI